jgi:hypothetical protein
LRDIDESVGYNRWYAHRKEEEGEQQEERSGKKKQGKKKRITLKVRKLQRRTPGLNYYRGKQKGKKRIAATTQLQEGEKTTPQMHIQMAKLACWCWPVQAAARA